MRKNLSPIKINSLSAISGRLLSTNPIIISIQHISPARQNTPTPYLHKCAISISLISFEIFRRIIIHHTWVIICKNTNAEMILSSQYISCHRYGPYFYLTDFSCVSNILDWARVHHLRLRNEIVLMWRQKKSSSSVQPSSGGRQRQRQHLCLQRGRHVKSHSSSYHNSGTN